MLDFPSVTKSNQTLQLYPLCSWSRRLLYWQIPPKITVKGHGHDTNPIKTLITRRLMNALEVARVKLSVQGKHTGTFTQSSLQSASSVSARYQWSSIVTLANTAAAVLSIAITVRWERDPSERFFVQVQARFVVRLDEVASHSWTFSAAFRRNHRTKQSARWWLAAVALVLLVVGAWLLGAKFNPCGFQIT